MRPLVAPRMSRRRKQAIAAAATLAAAVLQHSRDDAARALAQLVLDLQPWPAPRALRRRAYTEFRRLQARLKEVAEIATLVNATADAANALLEQAIVTKAAFCEEEQRLAFQRAVRACARHIAYNLRCIADAVCYGEVQSMFPSSKEEKVTHPSCLCQCACGPEAPRAEHDAGCPWAALMCRTCEGHGLCPGCVGDGTEPNHQPSGACA